MKKYFEKVLASIGLVALFFGFVFPTHADTGHKSANKPGISSEFDKSKKAESERDVSLRLLGDVNAAIEAAGVSGGDYTSSVTRKVNFDALRIGDWSLHFSIREESLLDPSPRQLDHEMEYIGVGYRIDNGKIKLFWDHTCHNPGRKLPKEKRNDIHWNELGIGYETTGMMLGHKNDGIKFNSYSEWLNTINWRASLSRVWMTTENDYEWIFKLGIRDDVFRMGIQVFYIQLILNPIYDDRGINLKRCIEIGDRIYLNEHIYLIPFASYKHFHDWYSLGEGEGFFYAGLCLEMGLGHKNPHNFSNLEETETSWSPKFHITGGYTNIVDNKDYGHSSDFDINLDLLKLDRDKTLSLSTYAGILTLPDDLNPYIVKYKIGPSLKIDLDNFDLNIFHFYSCLYGLEEKGVMKRYNILGLELKNTNASHWNWNLMSGFYPSTTNFDYWGDLYGRLGYNFYKKAITPYIHYSGHYLLGNNSEFGHAAEAGVKISGKVGSFSGYICLQNDFDVFRFGKGKQTLFGIRFRF